MIWILMIIIIALIIWGLKRKIAAHIFAKSLIEHGVFLSDEELKRSARWTVERMLDSRKDMK